MAAATSRAAPEARPGAVLKAIGLEKRYGSVHAVRGVDFALEAKSYVTLLGPSGCGKTSILRMIGGFEEISGGTLELDGRSLAGVPANLRPVNTVFQSYALFPHLSVAENVGFGLAYKRLDNAAMRRKVHEALATVRMTEMADRRPRQLSGGQQQRVALARAIVNEPQLLLLDEPLSALDRRMRKDMQIELKDIQRRLGLAFLHVTHDQEEAFALSDRIIVMNDGRIEQEGTPEEVYRRPATAYVADFIGGANRIPGRVVASRDGCHRIETALGTFEAPGVPALGPGAPATLCVRPEQLRIESGAAIRGTVSHLVFRGSEWLVELTAAPGLRLEVTVAEADPPPVGATIGLSFAHGAAWIAAGDGSEL